MSTRIDLGKATRIEGAARIHVDTEGGRVTGVRFAVQDFRGFEAFMRGKRAEGAAQTVSRVCGLCSVSHQVATLRAVEDAVGVVADESTLAVRAAAVLAERVASHAAAYFYLAMPDQVGATGGVFELARSRPEEITEAVALRRGAQRVIELLGGRAVHPVSFAVGGLAKPLSEESLEECRRLASEMSERALRLVRSAAGAGGGDAAAHDALGIALPVEHLANFVSFDETADEFVVVDRTGSATQRFGRRHFEEAVDELRTDWSFAKFPYLREMGFPAGIMIVGPLSRHLLDDSVAQDESVAGSALLERWGDSGESDLDIDIGMLDACRLREIVSAAAGVVAELDKVRPGPHPSAGLIEGTGSGIGVVEAPRGILVHRYDIEAGVVASVRLLVATQFNNAFLNVLLTDIAQAHVSDGAIDETGRTLMGRALRLFDPCLSCATH